MFVPDFELKLFLDVMPNVRPAWSVQDIAFAENYIRDRMEMVRAGVARCPTWFQEELSKIDSRLRCWWDVSLEVVDLMSGRKAPRNEWVIDRLQDEGIVEGLLRLAENESADYKAAIRKSASGLLEKGAYYLTVLRFKPRDDFQLDQKLLDALRAADMQRYKNPAEFIRQREAAAEAKEKANEKASNDAVLAAVDSLSDKQVHEFLEVSRALGTGETIVCHGEAEKFMDSIEEARRKAPPLPVNKPDIFKPKRKGHK